MLRITAFSDSMYRTFRIFMALYWCQ